MYTRRGLLRGLLMELGEGVEGLSGAGVGGGMGVMGVGARTRVRDERAGVCGDTMGSVAVATGAACPAMAEVVPASLAGPAFLLHLLRLRGGSSGVAWGALEGLVDRLRLLGIGEKACRCVCCVYSVLTQKWHVRG
jgi:hypothetical protein